VVVLESVQANVFVKVKKRQHVNQKDVLLELELNISDVSHLVAVGEIQRFKQDVYDPLARTTVQGKMENTQLAGS
jgi:hypothetical protein